MVVTFYNIQMLSNVAIKKNFIEALRDKKFPNNELVRRTEDKEDWEVMIADVCDITGT